jgi:putative iron-regulated protein
MKVKITFTECCSRPPRPALISGAQRTKRGDEMRTQLIFACLLGLNAMACGSDDDDGGTTQSFAQLAAPAIAQYGNVVYQSYSGSIDGAKSLDDACKAFVAAPSAATQQAAKDAWLASRPVYLQTEVYRFYGGPIDDDDGPEGQINAWPMDEVYIDYVEGDDTAGIINDPTGFPTIDTTTIASANMTGGEANVATGYHAVEFLLWGQDLSDTGAGARPHTDFSTSGGTHANQDRRGQYLLAASSLIVTDLESVQSEWAPDAENYRKSLNEMDAKEAVGLILTGMGALAGGELSGERMQVAFDSKQQEDEHSCFSDNTHVDHLNDQIGIENVYLGRFGNDDGPGLDDIVKAKDPALDTEMKDRMAAAKAAIQAIPKPFDQAILGDDTAEGRVKIKAAIDALKAQTETITKIAEVLGVTVNLE